MRVDQSIDGMPVYQRARRELVRPDGTVLYATERPLDPKLPRTSAVFVDDEAGAIRRAAAGALVSQARARKVWYPYADQLVAAWVVEAYTSDPASTLGDLVRTVIAADGRVIARESLVADSTFTYTVYAEAAGERHPFDSPFVDSTPHPTGTPSGGVPGYVAAAEVTIEGGLNIFADPWLDAGATETRGNNVDAYTDSVAPTGFNDGDLRATAQGTSFSHVYNTAQSPLATQEQQMAAVTALFFTINWLHDFWYDAGFTEAAGNAQNLNYGRGGIEGDVMLAEAQDNALDGSRNNANMSTPADGMSPRMQVFLWNGRDTRSMTLSPSGRQPATGVSSFGVRSFDVTGDIVLGQDGLGANPTDGCTPLTNPVAGKLVLVDRGNCTYKTKVTRAQEASALGVIIADNVESVNPPTMGDDANLAAEPTIPAVSITKAEGAMIKSELGAGTVSATLVRSLAPDLDGSLDATLVAHEFGHYLHHRLSHCTNAMCRAISEGWGDFVALLLLARPGDDLRGAFPFAIYTTQGYPGDPAYFGIRRAPYSVDFDINALMFRHMTAGVALPSHPLQGMNSNAQVHNAGEVWASALWEVYVALHEAAPPGEFFAVRAKMARYVVAGLQLVPEQATPMETRDAILAVALAESPADHAVMIQAFARRGFGSCAVPPPENSITFIGIVESTTIAGNLQLASLEIIDDCDGDSVIDAGETALVKMRVINQGHVALTDIVLSVTTELPGVAVGMPPVTRERLEPLETIDLDVEVSLDEAVTEALAGDLALTVTATGGCTDTLALPIAARLNVDDVPAASATDTFDSNLSFWEPWLIAWRHIRETPLNGIWHGDALAVQADVRLTSPRLLASQDKPLTITFEHKFQFELGNGTAWDGGVIEYSLDDGMSWTDVAEIDDPGYVATLTDESGNPLGLRAAFAGTSAAWPAYEPVTIELGDALAGRAFRLRFRIGTDGNVGTHGWDIDNVAFDGIVGTPFPAQVVDDGVCGGPPDDPIRAGGGGCCQAGGSSNAWLALGVLGLLARRRRATSTCQQAT